MVESIYKEFIDISPEQAMSRMEDLGLDRFQALQGEFKDQWHGIFRFILYAFSYDSIMLSIGDNWDDTKRQIYDKVGIKKDVELFEQVTALKSPVIAVAVTWYLKRQTAREFRHMCVLKDLYDQMCNSIYSNDIEFDQKRKNSKYMKELWEELEDYEQRVIQKYGATFMERKKDVEFIIKKDNKVQSAILEDVVN